jgi:hypothetical protein
MIETPDSVIPPLSEVKVIKVAEDQPDWAGQEGRLFRVGYYRKRDGLDHVWLVDDEGNYCKTVDQEMIKTHFEVVNTSTVTDLFGVNSPVIQAIPLVPPTPWDRLTRKVALVVIVCTLPVGIAFGSHGHLGRAKAAGLCAFIFFTTIWLRWDLGRKFWFWITLALLAAAHLPLLLFVRWTDTSYPGGYGDIPATLADFAIVYGTIRLIETAIAKRSQASR